MSKNDGGRMKGQMNVRGVPVTPEQIAACIARMQRGPFTATEIAVAARTHPEAYRVADRLIQRERKARNIQFDGRVWRWVAESAKDQP